MSLKKQIARNVARQEDAYLKQHRKDLLVDYRTLPRDQRSMLVNMSRHGITPMDVEKARRDAREEAFRDTAPAIQSAVYAAMAIVLHDEFGFEKADVLKALHAVDHKMLETLDTEELYRELAEKCEIRILGREGVGRIETVD